MATPEKPTKPAVLVTSPESQKTFDTFLQDIHKANEMRGIKDGPEIKMAAAGRRDPSAIQRGQRCTCEATMNSQSVWYLQMGSIAGCNSPRLASSCQFVTAFNSIDLHQHAPACISIPAACTAFAACIKHSQQHACIRSSIHQHSRSQHASAFTVCISMHR